MLNRAVLAGIVVAAGAFVFYLVGLVRDGLSPNEPYAAHVGLSLDQCVAAQSGMSEDEARAFCRRPVPKQP